LSHGRKILAIILKQKTSLHMVVAGMFGYGDDADKQQQGAA
jgi:hypothetical protein